MKALSIGNHHLGCRGYDGKEPIWEKEDQACREQGIENPFDKYTDPKVKILSGPGTAKKKRVGNSSRTPRWYRVFIWSRTSG